MNSRTDEIESRIVSETQAEVPRVGRRSPARATEPSSADQTERAPATEEWSRPGACQEPGKESFLFDDPYWDDAFDSYHDPTLRTCCRR